jgi:urea transporter
MSDGGWKTNTPLEGPSISRYWDSPRFEPTQRENFGSPCFGSHTCFQEHLDMIAARCFRRPSLLHPCVALRRYCTPAVERPVTPAILDESLRGMGQVVFCNSPLTGGIILGGLAVGDPWLATLGALGAVSSTATARAIGLDASAVSAGLAGYNGCLVGCAFSVFLGQPAWAPEVAVATLAASAATAPLLPALKKACGSVPSWTLGFNLTTLSVLTYTRPFDVPAAAAAAAVLPPSGWEYLAAPFCGVSQIFVVQSPLTGLALLGGIGLYSRGCAAHTLLGAAIGSAVGAAVGAPASEITAGLWGFNSALTSLAVSVFFVSSPASAALSVGGAATSAVLFGGLKTALAASCATPALTLPFCAVASACHLLHDGVAGLQLAAAPHSPERNSA